MLAWILVATGGAVGAVLRYGVGRIVVYFGADTPIGTFSVNFIGSYLLAILIFSSDRSGWMTENWRLLLAVGMLGAFTTMSTFSFESMKLLENREFFFFLLNVVGTIVLVLLAILLGKGTSTLLFR